MISARTKRATIEHTHTHTLTHRRLAKQTPAKYLPLTERKKSHESSMSIDSKNVLTTRKSLLYHTETTKK